MNTIFNRTLGGAKPLSFLLIAAAAWTLIAATVQTARAANFPVGTYVYAGALLNFKHEAMGTNDELQVQAVSTSGNVLSVSSVLEPDPKSGVNFRLEIPVSTKASAKSAVIGDAPRCVVISQRGSRGAATETFPPILCASAVTNCTVVWSDAISFTNDAGKVVEVPEDYIDGISWLMDFYGKSTYDPFADWDGDGVINYEEYVAGTNPFDPSHYLHVTDFSADEDATTLSFEYVGGHLYGLKSARSLSNPEWATTAFSTDDQANSRQTTIYGGDEDVGMATLYVTPVSDAPQKFFKVEAK